MPLIVLSAIQGRYGKTSFPAIDKSRWQRSSLRLQRLKNGWLKKEAVILELGDGCVAPDDVGEARLLKCPQLVAPEAALVPKTIAIADPLELIGDNSLKSGADTRVREMIFRQTANPEINRINIAVEDEQLHLQIGVAGDLRKTGDARKAIRCSHAVVIAQSVVAAALNIERRQIETDGARRAEEEISQIADDVGIDFLGIVT